MFARHITFYNRRITFGDLREWYYRIWRKGLRVGDALHNGLVTTVRESSASKVTGEVELHGMVSEGIWHDGLVYSL